MKEYGAAGPGAGAPGPPRKRGPDVNKLIPIVFILSLVTYLASSYVTLHLVPRLGNAEKDVQQEGIILTSLFGFFTLQLLYCYYLCIFTDPGGIPDTALWGHFYENKGDEVRKVVFETKKDGELRHCKWCTKYKPDRAHHCRVLGRCVLRMDHHCPWVYNTIGYGNHKYFYLLLFNSSAVLWLIALTFWETVRDYLEDDTVNDQGLKVFVALYAESLAVFVAGIVTSFFLFHTFLVCKNMTTIEFCEKHNQRSDRPDVDTGASELFSGQYSNKRERGGGASLPEDPGLLADKGHKFDIGVYNNLCATLGNNPLLWFVPFVPPPGDGVAYQVPGWYVEAVGRL
ncbi:unnamed protein product [Amoebophrya sp. A120]|nr:unnamed protein product [Amoebophrya sp. A120]|eukprot:GSA120T00020797001.1